MNELINDKGDCRTAPATPGLLTRMENLPDQVQPVAKTNKVVYVTK